jgi:hypothetical protein
MHNWMKVSRYTVLMVSGKPFSPSAQAMRISFSPWFFVLPATYTAALSGPKFLGHFKKRRKDH